MKRILALFILLVISELSICQSPNLFTTSLAFTENLGQVIDTEENIRNDILYTAQANGAKWFLHKDRMSIVFYQFEKSREETNENPKGDFDLAESAQSSVKAHRVDMIFEGCNPNPMVRTERLTRDYVNFYLPQCQEGLTNVRRFGKLIYQNLYDNIDFEIYQYGNGLKYDFVVHPGGDPTDIAIRYEGADSVEFRDNGIWTTTSLGEYADKDPVSFQQGMAISTSYSLSDQLVRFEIGDYDSEAILRIDPVLEWATLIGGSEQDHIRGVAVDNDNVPVMVGHSFSADFPITTGAYQEDYIHNDLILLKMDPEQQLIWSTYFGGTESDYRPVDPAVTDDNQIYIGCQTKSDDLPMTDYDLASSLTNFDGFVGLFDSSGMFVEGLVFGGNGTDKIEDIALSGDCLAVVGWTTSLDLPISVNAFQNEFGGEYDTFIMLIESSADSIYLTFFGGAEEDTGHACDFYNENLWVVGKSASADFLTSEDALYSEYIVPTGYYSVWDDTGTLVYSSFSGSDDFCNFTDVKCSTSDGCYIGGSADASILDAGYALNEINDGASSDAFIFKCASAVDIQWLRYVGGGNLDQCSEIALSGDGIAFAGLTYSQDLECSTDAAQTYLAYTPSTAYFIGQDVYWAKMDGQGEVTYLSYFGGIDQDFLRDIAADNMGNVYVVGWTESPYFPVSPDAFQDNEDFDVEGPNDANHQGFILKFASPPIELDYSDNGGIDRCIGEIIELSISSDQVFEEDNQFNVFLLDSLFDQDPQWLQSWEGVELNPFELQLPIDIQAGHYIVKVESTLPEIGDLAGILSLQLWDSTLPTLDSIPPLCSGETYYLDQGEPWYNDEYYFPGHSEYIHENIEFSHLLNTDSLEVGVYDIGYAIENACVTDTAWSTFEVVTTPQAYAEDLVICEFDTEFFLPEGIPSDGFWIGMDIFNDTLYQDSPGIYNIYYRYEDECGMTQDPVEVLVAEAPNIEFSLPDEIYCSTNDAQSLPEVESDWGTFTINEETVEVIDLGYWGAGEFALVYSLQDSVCGLMQYVDSIFIDAPVSPVLELPDSLCEYDEPYSVSFSPEGGIWSGTALTDFMFDPFTVGPGSWFVGYSFENACGYFEALDSVVVVATPPVPEIIQNGNSLSSSSEFGNQWYYENTIIPGANSDVLIINESGSYGLVVTIDGCESEFVSDVFTYLNIEENNSYEVQVYPNPSYTGSFTISTSLQGNKGVSIYDASGKLVEQFSFDGETHYMEISSKGAYTMEIAGGGMVYRVQLLID